MPEVEGGCAAPEVEEGCAIAAAFAPTLESIHEGVPMLSRPVLGDQLINGRFVEEVWKNGVLLEQGKIEKAIKRLMGEEDGAEMRESARDLKMKMRMCFESDESSQKGVDKLVEHILSL